MSSASGFDVLGSLSAPAPHVTAGAPVDTDALPCSRRGCGAEATWALRWNNPRLHAPERRKTWLACDEHRAHLDDFLSARGFLRETLTLGELHALQEDA